jgi:leader peptidase (prepilin peptidase)/N-methyltransferase
LIPVVSYIFLHGKCRNCGEKISLKYPVIEFLTGIFFVLIYLKYGLSLEFIKYVIFLCLLTVIGIIDYQTTDVYLKTTLTGIIIGVIIIIAGYFYGYSFMEYLYGAVLGGGVISIIILLTHGMGWGDAEICFMCGLYLGLRLTILMLFLSFVIGGLSGVVLIITKKKSKKDYIPFGPFISIAAVIAMLLGNEIINLYIALI